MSPERCVLCNSLILPGDEVRQSRLLEGLLHRACYRREYGEPIVRPASEKYRLPPRESDDAA